LYGITAEEKFLYIRVNKNEFPERNKSEKHR